MTQGITYISRPTLRSQSQPNSVVFKQWTFNPGGSVSRSSIVDSRRRVERWRDGGMRGRQGVWGCWCNLFSHGLDECRVSTLTQTLPLHHILITRGRAGEEHRKLKAQSGRLDWSGSMPSEQCGNARCGVSCCCLCLGIVFLKASITYYAADTRPKWSESSTTTSTYDWDLATLIWSFSTLGAN